MEVTNATVLTGGAITLIISGIIAALCIFCAYKKRNKIAAEAKKATEIIRRASSKIRRSVI